MVGSWPDILERPDRLVIYQADTDVADATIRMGAEVVAYRCQHDLRASVLRETVDAAADCGKRDRGGSDLLCLRQRRLDGAPQEGIFIARAPDGSDGVNDVAAWQVACRSHRRASGCDVPYGVALSLDRGAAATGNGAGNAASVPQPRVRGIDDGVNRLARDVAAHKDDLPPAAKEGAPELRVQVGNGVWFESGVEATTIQKRPTTRIASTKRSNSTGFTI